MFRNVLDDQATTPRLTLTVNGIETPAWEGETAASVLLRIAGAGRLTPVTESPRAPYCLMGVCFDCLAIVDGIPSTQTCLLPVTQGMRIERQAGPRRIA